MLTDAYGGVGGWVKKDRNAYGCSWWGRCGLKISGNAYGCLRWNKWVGRPKTEGSLLTPVVVVYGGVPLNPQSGIERDPSLPKTPENLVIR